MKPASILGISAFYHDSAAALVQDGRVAAAAQEERFSRRKHDPAFPRSAVSWCLEAAGLEAEDLDLVVFYEKPFRHFERLMAAYLACAPRGFPSFRLAVPVWLKQKIWVKSVIQEELGYEGRVTFSDHHESHAASAFYPSPFREAAVLTMDGAGEWATASWGTGSGNTIDIGAEMRFPHSLGLLYSAFTYYTGFKVNSAEYKVMGLAPYGEPKYARTILRELIDLKEDGSFRVNLGYFDYASGLAMTNSRFHGLFGGPPRKPESPITARTADLAASIQKATEEIMLRMARHVRSRTGMRRLCLAGGVALNCVGNGRIRAAGLFDDLWIQPAAGDAGGALGAALLGWHRVLGGERRSDGLRDSQRGSFLGPEFSDSQIEEALAARGAVYERLERGALLRRAAARLAAGDVLGWFSGKMEFGPRALGGRSILGDPRDPGMRSRMNLKIKFRESFRPFAPAILEERAGDYFEGAGKSPYMLLTFPLKSGREISDIPAVVHRDRSARVQTVGPEAGLFYDLLKSFERLTGCPLLVNTSFNVRGEPIVRSPEEAYAGFMRTGMDGLVMGSFYLEKSRQPGAESGETHPWKTEFPPD